MSIAEATREKKTNRKVTESREDAPLTLDRGPTGELVAVKGEKRVPVEVNRCFPWSEPQRFFSLRDADGNEVALISDLGDLDPGSRALVEQSLAEAGFLLEILGVESMEDEFEIRNWKVTTRQGSCTFQSKIGDWPRETPQGGMLISDVAGNLFSIPDPHALDEKSQKILWAFID